MRALGLGQLAVSGGLAPRGSGAADSDAHTDDAERRPRVASTPVFRQPGTWVTWAVFLFVAYIVARIVLR